MVVAGPDMAFSRMVKDKTIITAFVIVPEGGSNLTTSSTASDTWHEAPEFCIQQADAEELVQSAFSPETAKLRRRLQRPRSRQRTLRHVQPCFFFFVA